MRCPLCGNSNMNTSNIYLSDVKKKKKLQKCLSCGLDYFLDLGRSRKKIYDENYSVWGKDEIESEKLVEESKKEHFKHIFSQLRKKTSFKNKSLLDIGTGNGYLLDVAKKMGISDVYGLEVSRSAALKAEKRFPKRIFNCEIGKIRTEKRFDVITLTDLIEHLPNIRSDFNKIKSLLKPGGFILITTPNTDSFTRKLLAGKWFQYKDEHVIYFNKRSLKYLLDDFDILTMKNNTKVLKAGYYKLYLKKYSSRTISRMIPSSMERLSFTNPFVGEILVIAQKK